MPVKDSAEKQRRFNDVKVFISSTFTDLEQERNYIQQVVFPSLRSEYKELPINEIDLRWGITEEQAKEGKVLDLCLHYIQESKPFFIGILGDRYGTSFESEEVMLTPAVEENFPLVREDLKDLASATEIEILNGVVRNPDARAIFFIKKNAGRYPGESMAQWSRLISLKNKIKASGHEVVEYSSLEDFDKIKDFIKKHIGPASMYNTPTEGYERADRISRKHYERSLDYVREVPYDPRLDRLLEMIDETVSKSKNICAFIGGEGLGKSTTLAYMAHNFTGERIYVPLYGDIDEMPSTVEEIVVFLMNTLKNSIFKRRKRQTKWYQFKEWFRDGLKEINYDNAEDLAKEILRHKWCFILDNYEAGEWMGYKGFANTSFSKARKVYDKILFYFLRISNRYKRPYDVRQMIVRDMTRNEFVRKVRWNSNEPIFDLSQQKWFRAQDFIPEFMVSHSKNLCPHHVEALVNSPMRYHPGHVRLVCNYMVEFVKFEQIDTFVSLVNKTDSTNYPYALYIDKILEAFGKHVAIRSFVNLFIFRDGISLKEFERLSGLNHIDFLFLIRRLNPFIVFTGTGIRIRDFMVETRVVEILEISPDIIESMSLAYAKQYRKELFEDRGFAHYKNYVLNSFPNVVGDFASALPEEEKQKLTKTKRTYPQKYWKALDSRWAIGYLSQPGRLTDEIIAKVYCDLCNSGSPEWGWTYETMRNYLMACYSAGKTDWLMETVHNPIFIKNLWSFPLYLFVWDSYLDSGGEFAAPYSPLYGRDSYDIDALIRIMNMLQNTFYSKILKPFLKGLRPGEQYNYDYTTYLKNYPKK